jgi:uncharacterized RDD family membrane protein YckC
MSDTQESKMQYATFMGRMLASTIDTVLSSIILVPIMNVFSMFFKVETNSSELVDISIAAKMTEDDAIATFASALPSILLQSLIVATIVLVFWFYRGATPGKMILKMKIADAKTGEPASKKQLIIRYLGYFVSLLPLCLGFVWIYYDKKRQGFHDKLAGTVVVKY